MTHTKPPVTTVIAAYWPYARAEQPVQTQAAKPPAAPRGPYIRSSARTARRAVAAAQGRPRGHASSIHKAIEEEALRDDVPSFLANTTTGAA